MPHQFCTHVRLRIKYDELFRIKPLPGLTLNFYAPIYDGVNLLKNPRTAKALNQVDMSVSGSMINPNPLQQRDQGDIDNFLAKQPVVKDHLRHTDQKELITNQKTNNEIQDHWTFLDNPILDGQNDYQRSKATDVHSVAVDMEQVNELETYFEKRKALFGRTKFKDIKAKVKDHRTGRKIVLLDMGKLSPS